MEEDLLFHSGHTWVRAIGFDLAFVGATRFALEFLGELGKIALPHEHHRLKVGEPAWTLISLRGRKLAQASPLTGRVLVTNTDLEINPRNLSESPYQQGWILCIQSPSLHQYLQNLLPRETNGIWMERANRVMARVLGPGVAIPSTDGRWNPNFGDRLTNQQWEELRHKLFPACRHSGPDSYSLN
jgi:glycine cleavage system H protein